MIKPIPAVVDGIYFFQRSEGSVQMKYKVRNDFVLLHVNHMDQMDKANEFIVAGFGPNVVGLKLGDKVLLIGKSYAIPDRKDLIILKEENVVLIINNENKQ